MNDPMQRTINRDVVAGSVNDTTRFNPWRAPGFAPVYDACGMAGGTDISGTGGAAVFAPTWTAKLGDKGTQVLKPGPAAAHWYTGESVEVSWGIRYNHGVRAPCASPVLVVVTKLCCHQTLLSPSSVVTKLCCHQALSSPSSFVVVCREATSIAFAQLIRLSPRSAFSRHLLSLSVTNTRSNFPTAPVTPFPALGSTTALLLRDQLGMWLQLLRLSCLTTPPLSVLTQGNESDTEDRSGPVAY